MFLAALALGSAMMTSWAAVRATDADSAAPELVTISVAADSQNAGYEAYKAFDGDPGTFWHTQFSSAPMEYTPIPISRDYLSGSVDERPRRIRSREYDANRPFELRVDLGAVYILDGIRYYPRNDGNENGRVGEYDVYALETLPASSGQGADDADGNMAPTFDADGVWDAALGAPLISGAFDAGASPQTVTFPSPTAARYLIFRAKSETRGQEFAAVAELELLAENHIFRASAAKISLDDAIGWTRELAGVGEEEFEALGLRENQWFLDIVDQYNRLADELARADYYAAIASQLASPEAGLADADRDPLDVVFRRVNALWRDLRGLDETSASSSASDADVDAERAFFETLAETAAATPATDAAKRFQLYYLLSCARRTLLMQREELDFDELLFVKRNRARYSHICDQFYGRSAEAGGGLYVLTDFTASDADEGARNMFALTTLLSAETAADARKAAFVGTTARLYQPKTRNLLENSVVGGSSRLTGRKLENGAMIAPDLSFDGRKIAFAWCECEGSADHLDSLDLTHGHTQEGRCYHIFTCDADGSNLTQVTDGTWNDIDPCFLPNGRMAFITERRGGYLRCGRDCPNYTLFDMNPDGTKIRPLSLHETNEWAPSVSNDGQILWTRWDYIDRHGCTAHGAWTTTPDGRNPRAVCGNYAPRRLRPDSVLDIRSIPGSNKLLATAGPHHGQAFGSIVTIDPNAPDDPWSPVTRMTPDVGFPESQDGAQVWGTPWPLAEDLFLAVADYSFVDSDVWEWSPYRSGNYGIYLADAFGNRELLYRDPGIGASTPIPFVPRETPPVVASLVDESEIVDTPYLTPPPFDGPRPMAVCAIQNVYASDRPLKDRPERKVAAIRVVQVFCMSVPSGRPPYEVGLREATSTDSVKLARRVWGVAPVEKDGSACFYVPADCELYFQTLDEEGLVIRSMRSGTALRANERLSCVGCHESRETASAPMDIEAAGENDGAQIPIALRREPSTLTPEGVGTQPVNFPELVQPILDEHCVDCHASDDAVAKGAPDLSRTPSHGFYASYWNLTTQGFAFTDYKDPMRSTPEEFGARASKLYPLLEDHHGVALSDAERRRIALWLDTSSNFYGVYEQEGCEKEFRGERALPTLE